MLVLQAILLASLLHAALPYENPATCSSLYNYLTHACEDCPANTVATSAIGFCNCTGQFYPNPNTVGFKDGSPCVDFGTAPGAGEIIAVRDVNGALNPQILSCNDAYPNSDKTACIPCGVGIMCVCSDSSKVAIGEACVTKTTSESNTDLFEKYLFERAANGCISNNQHDSCQILLNQCAAADYSSNNKFCALMSSNTGLYSAKYSDFNTSLGIYASSIPGTNSTTVKNTLTFKLFKYDIFGNLLDVKPLDKDLIPCIATPEDIIKFQSFGLNLLKTCSSSDVSVDPNYFYDVYVVNSEGKYVQVFATYNTLSTYYGRLVPGGISSSIEMVYNSYPPLTTPYLNLTSLDTPTILTSSNQEKVNITLVAPFIVFNIGVLLLFILNFYKYMKYNPDETNDPYYFFKALLILMLSGLKHWGIGMWIWLFGVSAYCFCFYKFQQTVYLLMPDTETDWAPYYHSFMALFYVQFVFMLFSIFLLIYDMGSTTDYFLIDWEKEKNASKFGINMGGSKRNISVWRKVLLVNQLYEMTINRIINMEFVTLFSLLFLKGLNWINLSYQIPNTRDLDNDSSSVRNIVLSYFIITFVFFVVAAGQYILRHLVKIWMPMPYEDFVDLCAISNISLIIFDEALHGYYIHGMNPFGQAEGSLQYIESVFEKESRSFGKSRAFRNDDPDQVQTFEVVFPFEIRQSFQMKYKTQYLQKLVGKAYNTSMFSKPIPEMLDENDYKEIEQITSEMLDSFKYYLEGVKTSQFNVKERTFLQKLVSCPLDMELIGKLPIFFKDRWNEFTNVLMCGHEFLFLMNTINLVNIFYVATRNIFMAVFITMVISRVLIKNFADFMVKRNISKNTLIDDKFFN